MIEKEAKEINYVDPFRSPTQHGLYKEAKGYLEALEKAGVLEEALKFYEKPVFCRACMLSVQLGDTAKEALAKFVKEK